MMQLNGPTKPMFRARGLTLIEVMIAMFIFLVGVLGVLAALPSGVNAAHYIMFQDAAIHLSRSKFAELRRDRVDPRVDLVDGSPYMDAGSSPPRRQEIKNGNPGGWRDFAHGAGDTYENFDDIEHYQWCVDQDELKAVSVDSGNNNSPVVAAGPELNVTRVTLVIGMKGSKKEMRFTQYMYSYGK
jgi:prepilin-type N-terminal cleavage/methylation domain-containing protein